MGGERLGAVEIDARGLVGDRWFAVEDSSGHFASGKDTRRFRRRDAVFSYTAKTRPDGAVSVTGPAGAWTAGSTELDTQLGVDMGAPVRVVPERSVPHQDAGAFSLVGTATLQWCADQWGIDADPRRLRVNAVVATTEPFIEESWLGKALSLGPVALNVVSRTPRCRMVDIAQDGFTPGDRLLKRLGAERDLALGVYADVTRPGLIRVGDRVTVLD